MKITTAVIAKKVAEKNNMSQADAYLLVTSVMASIKELIREGYRELDLHGIATLSFKVVTPKRFFNVTTKELEEGRPRVKTIVKVKDSLKEIIRRNNVLAKLF